MPPHRRRRRYRSAKRPLNPWWWLAALGLVLFFAGAFFGSRLPFFQSPPPPPAFEAEPTPTPRGDEPPADSYEPLPPRAAEQLTPSPESPEPEAPSPVAAEAVPSSPAPGGGARLALVIDDLGRSLRDVEALAALGVPMSYAVLPFESRTAEVVDALARRGAEVLCHLPMEPSSGADPGPGALRAEMGPRKLARMTRSALEAVPGAVGVNNHMGSRLTADERAMSAVLEVVSDRDLFFLDSRTGPDSVAYRLAVGLGVPTAERQVFLDGDPSPAAIREQFARFLEQARRRGAAIAIGHPYPTTLEVLAQVVPEARAAGYEFVPVSYLLDRAADSE